ncbi:MAG: HD domain-containing protein, partial [Lachnospiraceae bacterium]|nr:HD domain-containing protein [Lachnospiraceae bacterium]
MESQTKRTNRVLLIGWCAIVFILFIMYLMEVFRGDRTPGYMVVFSLFTILPQAAVSFLYLKNPDNEKIQYHIVIGYTFMYAFVLFTGNTPLVWTYILPMLSLLVLYHNPRLIQWAAVIANLLNIAEIVYRYVTGDLPDILDRDIRIQIAVLAICFIALYFATIIYKNSYDSNLAYEKDLNEQKEELYQQAEEVEALNGELNEYADSLTKKNEELRKMSMQTIMTIANTIDAKDEYTRGHSRRVSEYSAAIAEELGFKGDELRDIRFIGLLHDIGKIGVPDNVLNKAGKLSKAEYTLMQEHTTTGGEILKDITMIDNLDVGAKYHHERYDGSGYPEGLKGEEIPLIARIIGVADAYDAMTSNRVYRRHLSHDRVVEELKKGRGSQFDPKVCDVLLKLMEEDRLPKLNPEDESIEVKQGTKILSRVIDRAEALASEEFHYDDLTGTLSRETGTRVIQEKIGEEGQGSIFIFDIDNFRRVNEKEGFMIGDRYLNMVAKEIRKLSEDITISRFGSDEFVAYLPRVDSQEDAESTAAKFVADIRHISETDPAYELLSVSLGITQVATEKDRVLVLYENASKALFMSKQYGEGSYFYYRFELDEDDDVAVANSADLKRLVEFLANPGVNDLKNTPETEALYTSVNELIKEKEDVHIVLFTLRMTGSDKIDPEGRSVPMELLERAIEKSIREPDVTMKYSNVQRVLL